MAEKFDRVAAAGFDGMTIDLGALSMDEAAATIPHFERTGLLAGLTAFPTSIASLRSQLQFARQLNVPYVVVIGQDMPVKLDRMVRVVESWLEVAREEGMPLQFETHRNGIMNDLFVTVQLLELIPELRLSADLSHYVVDREMPCPPSSTLQSLIDQVLERSDSFQGRVAARGQIQVALNFPQNQKWVLMFREWWRRGFESWKLRHHDEAMVFLCELGPPDYAITEGAGRELTDRWQESLLLMRWAGEIWASSHTGALGSPTSEDC